MTDFQRNVFCIAGLPFDAITEAETVAQLRQAAQEGRRLFFSTPNLNFLVAAQTDDSFRHSVLKSDLSLADGMPVIWLARLLGLPIPERVAGAGVFEALRKAPGTPLTVCFFGGPPGAAAQASAKLNEQNCGLQGVGGISPGYASLDEMSDDTVVAAVNACNADFIVVALGARKGQAWIERNGPKLNAPLISHLGAVVNFTAGWVSRAPRWMQIAGMEWLWRIFKEPYLWRRYWSDGLALLGMLFFQGPPLVLSSFLRKPDRPPMLHTETRDGVVLISLSGSWSHSASVPLREAFQKAAAAGQPVEVDLQDTTWLDSACIALLMLLLGHQRSRGLGFAIRRYSVEAKKLLCRHGGKYLLD